MKPKIISLEEATNLNAVLRRLADAIPDPLTITYAPEIARAIITSRTLSANATNNQKRKEKRDNAQKTTKTEGDTP